MYNLNNVIIIGLYIYINVHINKMTIITSTQIINVIIISILLH